MRLGATVERAAGQRRPLLLVASRKSANLIKKLNKNKNKKDLLASRLLTFDLIWKSDLDLWILRSKSNRCLTLSSHLLSTLLPST